MYHTIHAHGYSFTDLHSSVTHYVEHLMM